MNEKIKELEAIMELLYEWVMKHNEVAHVYACKGYTNIFNDPWLPEEQRIDLSHFYEPIKTTAGDGATTVNETKKEFL